MHTSLHVLVTDVFTQVTAGVVIMAAESLCPNKGINVLAIPLAVNNDI